MSRAATNHHTRPGLKIGGPLAACSSTTGGPTSTRPPRVVSEPPLIWTSPRLGGRVAPRFALVAKQLFFVVYLGLAHRDQAHAPDHTAAATLASIMSYTCASTTSRAATLQFFTTHKSPATYLRAEICVKRLQISTSSCYVKLDMELYRQVATSFAKRQILLFFNNLTQWT